MPFRVAIISRVPYICVKTDSSISAQSSFEKADSLISAYFSCAKAYPIFQAPYICVKAKVIKSWVVIGRQMSSLVITVVIKLGMIQKI